MSHRCDFHEALSKRVNKSCANFKNPCPRKFGKCENSLADTCYSLWCPSASVISGEWDADVRASRAVIQRELPRKRHGNKSTLTRGRWPEVNTDPAILSPRSLFRQDSKLNLTSRGTQDDPSSN
ncbi:unnamed protein product [Caretta caretta]